MGIDELLEKIEGLIMMRVIYCKEWGCLLFIELFLMRSGWWEIVCVILLKLWGGRNGGRWGLQEMLWILGFLSGGI